LDKPVSDIKLACRFYQEPAGWERISSNLSSKGWIKIDRRVVKKDELEIEYTVESIDRLEILLSLKSRAGFPNVETFKKLLECLLTDCWYIDVYYCFRNINVESIARELGLDSNSNEVKRLKLGGSEILVEAYPSVGKIIVSQRISLRDINYIEKIYSKLFRKILTNEVSQN
jgi:hypothetical protein